MSSQKALELLTLLTSSTCTGQAPSTLLRLVPKTQTALSSKNWPTFFSQMEICMYVYICKHVCIFFPSYTGIFLTVLSVLC